MSPPQDIGDQALLGNAKAVLPCGTRGLFAGGGENVGGAMSTAIDFICISNLGDAESFGDLLEARMYTGGVHDDTRACFMGGYPPTATGVTYNRGLLIDYVEMATEGNAVDFGDDLTKARYGGCGVNSPTRGCMCGGYGATGGDQDVIDYITIQTTGTCTDWGDLSTGTRYDAGVSSDTRGVIAMGGGSAHIEIEFILIDTGSSSSTFGDLTEARHYLTGLGDGTRGIYGGGYNNTDLMSYITIASEGDAQVFGDLASGHIGMGGCADDTTGVFAGGSGGDTANMQSLTIGSLGDATVFGVLTSSRKGVTGVNE